MPAAILENNTRQIDIRVQFQWDGTNWSNETDNLLKVSGALETVPFNEAFQAGKQVIQQASVTLANDGQRYSIYNADSPLYSYIANAGTYHRKCKIEMAVDIDGPWQPIFTGYIKLPREQVHSAQVTFIVWDAGEFLRQRHSSAVYLNKLEHEIVIIYLEMAGLVDGEDFISPTYAAAHATTATIDYSSVVIPYSWLDDEQIWDELVDIAQASGARIYVHKDGKIYFEKAWRWGVPYTPTVSITVTDYAELEPAYDDKTFYDEVLVGYAPRIPGDDGFELWKMQRNKLIMPGATETVESRLRYPALSIVPPVANTHYYLRGLSGADLASSCTITFTYYTQQVKAVITNNGSVPVTLGNFAIKGRALVGQPSEQVRREIESPEHSRRLEVRNNPYLLSEAQATSTAEALKWWCETPKMVVTLSKMRGDPSLRLGQKVIVTGPSLVAFHGIITRINNTITIEGRDKIKFVQDLTVLQNVFVAETGYFTIGVDTLGTAKELWV